MSKFKQRYIVRSYFDTKHKNDPIFVDNDDMMLYHTESDITNIEKVLSYIRSQLNPIEDVDRIVIDIVR